MSRWPTMGCDCATRGPECVCGESVVRRGFWARLFGGGVVNAAQDEAPAVHPRTAGRAAYRPGGDPDALNPHPSGTPEWTAWRNGWFDGHEKGGGK